MINTDKFYYRVVAVLLVVVAVLALTLGWFVHKTAKLIEYRTRRNVERLFNLEIRD